MNVAGLTSMSKKGLSSMNKSELMEFMEAFELDAPKGMTNAEMVKAIQDSGKYNVVKEVGPSAKIVSLDGKVDGKKVRVHPVFGEYKKVIVHPRDPKDTSLFFSINAYTVEFHAGDVVDLPKGMIKFIKSCYTLEHYFDKTGVSENGNLGVHATREVPVYFVTDADEED